MIISITNIAILTACFINIFIGLLVINSKPRTKVNIFLSLFIACIVGWSVSIMMMTVMAQVVWPRLAFFFTALAFTFFNLFLKKYLEQQNYFKTKILYLLSIVGVLFSISSLSDLVIKSLQASSDSMYYVGVSLELGIFYTPLLVFYLLNFLFNLYLMYSGYKIMSETEKKQLKSFFIGIFSFAFFALITNLLLPSIGIFNFNNLGPAFSVIMVSSLSYSILKHHLFSIKVIAAELLTFIIWLEVFIQTIASETLSGRFLGLITLILAIFAGIFLIKSVKKEVALREEIEQLAGRLKSVNRIMSHDIKNVLGKDKDMFGMLLDGSFGAVSDQARPFLEQAHDDTKKLIRSVIVILESGQDLVLKPEPFDFKEAVLEVVHDVESEAKTKGLSLTTNISEEGDYTFVGDRVQLVTHVLKNLVENAVNYTLAGGVTVGLSKKGNAILFSVKDTGIGISDEDKPNLFKEGGHGKDSLKVNVHSTGYGLFSVKKIVDAHKGKVWFDTAAGKGTTFWVEMKGIGDF